MSYFWPWFKTNVILSFPAETNGMYGKMPLNKSNKHVNLVWDRYQDYTSSRLKTLRALHRKTRTSARPMDTVLWLHKSRMMRRSLLRVRRRVERVYWEVSASTWCPLEYFSRSVRFKALLLDSPLFLGCDHVSAAH